jgi:hypothetical protein
MELSPFEPENRVQKQKDVQTADLKMVAIPDVFAGFLEYDFVLCFVETVLQETRVQVNNRIAVLTT